MEAVAEAHDGSFVSLEYTCDMKKQFLACILFALCPLSASARSIPQGASRVEMGTFSLSAPCDASDAVITSITLKRLGLGDQQDINRVYIMKGVQRISTARSFSTQTQLAVLTTRRLLVPACEKQEFTIMADFSAQAATGGLHVIRVDSVETEHSVVAIQDESSLAPTQTVPQSTQEIRAEYLQLLSPVRYGSKQTVGRFSLKTIGNNDVAVSAITFTNKGKARNSDLQQLRLKDGNTTISASVTQLQENKVRFEMDPPLLLSGNKTVVLTIQADIRASRRKTIQLIIEEPSDVEAVSQQRNR